MFLLINFVDWKIYSRPSSCDSIDIDTSNIMVFKVIVDTITDFQFDTE